MLRWPFTPRWSEEPEDADAFTSRHDKVYTRTAALHAWAVARLPVWRTWLSSTLPELRGPRILEVAVGTGYLLDACAARHRVVGLDLNRSLLRATRARLAASGHDAPLVRGDAGRLPFGAQRFDDVLCTMALSGFPRAEPVLREMRRVLRPDGRLVLLDVAPPRDANLLGSALVALWKRAGDVIRDVPPLLERAGLRLELEREVGGHGSVHLYRARPAPGTGARAASPGTGR